MHRIALVVGGAATAAAALLVLPAPSPASPAAVRPPAPADACPTKRLFEHDTVYTDLQVDRTARPRRRNPEIPWPGSTDRTYGATYLSRISNLSQGEVELRFVVDEKGCPDLETVQVVFATDSAFAEVVREALPSWRFEPARKAGKTVPQMLQWRWVLYKRAGARVPGTE